MSNDLRNELFLPVVASGVCRSFFADTTAFSRRGSDTRAAACPRYLPFKNGMLRLKAPIAAEQRGKKLKTGAA
jgi:hypothetical protein